MAGGARVERKEEGVNSERSRGRNASATILTRWSAGSFSTEVNRDDGLSFRGKGGECAKC